MAYNTIELERDGLIGVVKLNRPDRLNAFSAELREEQQAAIRELNDDPGIAVIILAGNGRAYSAGADLTTTGPGQGNQARPSGGLNEWITLCQEAKPMIAAPHGYTVGMGVTQILHCDIRICGEDTKFGFRFVAAGMVPEIGSTSVLPRMIGLGNAIDVCMRARMLPADEALRMGLVSEVVPNDQLLDRAKAIAQEIIALPPPQLRMTKDLFQENSLRADLQAVATRENEVLSAAQHTPEFKEAVAALMEKRPATYYPRA